MRIREALRELLGISDKTFDSKDDLEKACLDSIKVHILDEDGHLGPLTLSWLSEAVDKFDQILSRGASAAAANVMIVLDQFEELFDVKIGDTERFKTIEFIKHIFSQPDISIYLAVTMRSEELHRCSEHLGLANVVNKTFYLVDLIDGDSLTTVIRGPAQIVLKAWGLSDREPFSVDALRALEETYSEGNQVALSADKLPLMQHLLPLAWDRAVRRWSAGDGDPTLRVEINDLLALPGWGDLKIGTLRGVLSARADQVFAEATTIVPFQPAHKNRLSPSSADDLEKLLKVAFVLLANEDNRGNPKRDFVSHEDIKKAAGVVERSQSPNSTAWDTIIEQALKPFETAGLLTQILDDNIKKYTVLHEAFIRGWRRYVEWVAESKSVKAALREAAKMSSPKTATGLTRVLSWLMADRERRAQELVSESDAKILSDNIYGRDNQFSKDWALKHLK